MVRGPIFMAREVSGTIPPTMLGHLAAAET